MPLTLHTPFLQDGAFDETECSHESSKHRFAQCNGSSALTGFDRGLDPTVFEVEFPSVVNCSKHVSKTTHF